MLGLLERRIESVEQRLVLLAPATAHVPSFFQNVAIDPRRHERHIREMQQLRGGIYLQDGAVREDELAPGGLHATPEDANSWHLLMFREQRRLSSCIWYMEHENTATFDQLRVRRCPLGDQPSWRTLLKRAVASELTRARHEGLRYAEVGGWAVAKESRCTSEGLLLALGAYSLGRVFGDALGMTNATVRNASSTILKRIGGSPFEVDGQPLPRYYDPKYDCDMELLRFDSRRPAAKFSLLTELLRYKLAKVQVVACQAMPARAPEPVRAPEPAPALALHCA